jgi:hypothetical protein
MPVELIENGIEVEKRKQQEFFELAERFRTATDPEEAKRLGDELGRMVFGSQCPKLSVRTTFPQTSANICSSGCAIAP